MTLDELNAHLTLIQKLNTAREMLQSMQDSVLRAQSFDGMPHASGNGDRTASLAFKCAEQEEKIALYEKQVKESEVHIKAFVESIEDDRTNLIFYLRFICGYEWQEVAYTIGGKNTEGAVKSICYRYLQSANSFP